jgi:hypothetical protein
MANLTRERSGDSSAGTMSDGSGELKKPARRRITYICQL